MPDPGSSAEQGGERIMNGRSRMACAGAFVVVALAYTGAQGAGQWRPLAEDGLHDPENPALELLQEPTEALSVLPPDTAGNKVDWINALRGGYIRPRTSLEKNVQLNVLESEILMQDTGEMPMVRFPHKPHTEWLDCANCHDELFATKAGETPVNMLAILEGKYCGVCHGAVSFPLTECKRCHSVPRETAATPPSGGVR